jgi:predicted outer membrane protein
MSRRTRRSLRVECLEERVVLSLTNFTVTPVPATVPGGVYLAATGTPTSTSLTSTDSQTLQSEFSGNSLEVFLSQTELLLGSLPSVEQYAASVLADRRDSSFTLQSLANAKGVTLDPTINAQGMPAAAQLLAAANSPIFDQIYLDTMIQATQTDVANAQKELTTTTDPQLLAFLRTVIPIDQLHLTEAQALLTASPGGTTITNPAGSTSGTSALSTADASIAQQGYSASTLDKYLSQLTLIADSSATTGGTSTGLVGIGSSSSSASIQSYAQMLVTMHSTANIQFESLGATTSTPLVAGIAPADLALARQVIASAFSSSGSGVIGPHGTLSNFDTGYLTTMEIAHSSGLYENLIALNQAQNAQLKQIIQASIPVYTSHLQGAATLLSGSGNTSTQSILYINRLYNTVLARVPLLSEVVFWENELAGPLSQLTVYNDFFYSTERQTSTPVASGGTILQNSPAYVNSFNLGYNPPQTSQVFVDSLYFFILGRAPDPAGEAFWIGRLNTRKASTSSVLAAFLSSAEYVSDLGFSPSPAPA